MGEDEFNPFRGSRYGIFFTDTDTETVENLGKCDTTCKKMAYEKRSGYMDK